MMNLLGGVRACSKCVCVGLMLPRPQTKCWFSCSQRFSGLGLGTGLRGACRALHALTWRCCATWQAFQLRFQRHKVPTCNVTNVPFYQEAFPPSNVSRDRGLRAVLEMVGSVIVLFALSWRLAPVCSIVIIATAAAAAIYRWVHCSERWQAVQGGQASSPADSWAYSPRFVAAGTSVRPNVCARTLTLCN
jgi:hypothetical protein